MQGLEEPFMNQSSCTTFWVLSKNAVYDNWWYISEWKFLSDLLEIILLADILNWRYKFLIVINSRSLEYDESSIIYSDQGNDVLLNWSLHETWN
jgi:hypothetical protein